MSGLAEAQRAMLEKAGEQSGRWADLLYYHALLGQQKTMRTLWESIAHPHAEDRATYWLLSGEADAGERRDFAPLLDSIEDPWVFHTLVKRHLSQDDAPGALRIASIYYARGHPDSFLFNIVAKYFLRQREWELALGTIERCLRLCPYQRDMVELREKAQARQAACQDLFLDTVPRLERVGFYAPAYNVERFIGPCLEGFLSQSYPLEQVVVVDDASPDSSIEIARRYPVSIVRHEENRGLAASRNAAFQAMDRCGYIGAIDTDAVPEPGYTKRMMMEFENAPERLACLGGRLIEVHTDTAPDRWRQIQLCQDHGTHRFYASVPAEDGTEARASEILFYRRKIPGIFGANTLMRREAVLAVGGYNEKYRTNNEDMEIGTRLRDAGYDTAFTPHATARHHRKDDVESVLRTQWNYDYWFVEENGLYASEAAVVYLMELRLGESGGRMQLDFGHGFTNGLYISFLVYLYSLLRDLAVSVEHGALAPAQALHVQNGLLGVVARMDEAAGDEALLSKVRADLDMVLLPENAEPELLSPDAEAELQAQLAAFEGFLEQFAPATYGLLVSYPECPPLG